MLWDTAVCFSQAHESAQTYVIQIFTEHHLRLILSLLNILEDLRLGTIPVYSLLLDVQGDCL